MKCVTSLYMTTRLAKLVFEGSVEILGRTEGKAADPKMRRYRFDTIVIIVSKFRFRSRGTGEQRCWR